MRVGDLRRPRAGRAPRPGRGRPDPGSASINRVAARARRRPSVAVEDGLGAAGEQPAPPCLRLAARRRAGPARQAVAGGVPDHVVVGQHPGATTTRTRAASARLSVMIRRNCAASKSASQQVEVERLAQALRAGVAGTPGGVHPRLGDGGPRRVVRRRRPPATAHRSRARRRGRRTDGCRPSAARLERRPGSAAARRRSLVSMWATSTRKPSTPRSAQNRRVRTKSSRTSGLSQLRSGCSTAKRCRYHCPSGDALPGRSRRTARPSPSGGCDAVRPVPSRKM